MRRSLSLLTPLLVLLSGLLPPLHGQSSSSLPGCEVSPDVQSVLDRELDPKLLDRMPFADRFPLERNTLEALISKYPRDLEPYTRLRDLFFRFSPKEYADLRDRWIKMGREHPDDPLALLLASEVLNRVDTPESIRLLQSARVQAPEFPWAARDLAAIYSDGKRADPAKAKENIDAFFAICPASSDPYAQYLLPGADPLLQPKVEEPFQRIGAERLASGHGAGLGLSIVSAIAAAHGGALRLTARPEGGLRVVIELPVAGHL